MQAPFNTGMRGGNTKVCSHRSPIACIVPGPDRVWPIKTQYCHQVLCPYGTLLEHVQYPFISQKQKAKLSVWLCQTERKPEVAGHLHHIVLVLTEFWLWSICRGLVLFAWLRKASPFSFASISTWFITDTSERFLSLSLSLEILSLLVFQVLPMARHLLLAGIHLLPELFRRCVEVPAVAHQCLPPLYHMQAFPLLDWI